MLLKIEEGLYTKYNPSKVLCIVVESEMHIIIYYYYLIFFTIYKWYNNTSLKTSIGFFSFYCFGLIKLVI